MRRLLCASAIVCVLAMIGGCATGDRADDNAATQAVWVLFTEDAAHSAAPAAIGSEALAQRALLGISGLTNDAPIPPTLIARVLSTGAVLREQSRWLRAISVDASPDALRRMRKIRGVAAIRPVGQMDRLGDIASDARAPYSGAYARDARALQDSAFYGPNWNALRVLGIPPANSLGFNGSGIRIALIDTGFRPQHESLQSRTVIAQRDFINGDANVANEPTDTDNFDQQRHGTWVWSILGGFTPGTLVGPAWGASFILAKVDEEPGDTRVDEDRWIAAVEWADSLGARIINSSVAFRFRFIDRNPIPFDSLNGDSLLVTRAADEAAKRGILVVQAIGDAGLALGTLAAPSDADSIIAVGAVDLNGVPAVFSGGATARGPTFDGRFKPELVAPGVGLMGASSQTLVSFDFGLAGTSFATPLVSAGAAMFMQAWPGLSADAVRRALLLSGNRAATPDNTFGAGIPDIGAAILFPEGISLNVVTPTDLTGSVTSLAPTFSWTTPLVSSVMRPVLYRVEVALDTGFTNIVYTDTVREASSLAAKRALPASPRLFWRVVATTPVGIRRASLREQFRVPDWVELLTLAEDKPTFSATTRPELAWLPLAAPTPIGPLSYEVQILAHNGGQVVQVIAAGNSSTVRVREALTPNLSYRWRVIARTLTGQVDTVESKQPFVIATDEKPPATILYGTFPNPFPNFSFGSTARIWFDLAEDSRVTLTVSDLRGRLVKQLIPARGCSSVTLPAGIYGRSGQALNDPCIILEWDGRNDDGAGVASGVYILRLQAGSTGPLIKRMLYSPAK